MARVTPQKVILALVGIGIMLLGINIGIGGIQTLGWQGPRDFIIISDAAAFHTQDSHIRFVGGVWFGVGGVFLAGALALERLRPTLIILCGIIALSGLFRLSATETTALFSLAIVPSLAFELLGFSALGLWLSRPLRRRVQRAVSRP